ncbi:MAG: protoporphyrinogen oxidase [Elusimicrobia bacterium]|nr:protoporphyrinogen oxidase [Elusimicrobiota bacterium]
MNNNNKTLAIVGGGITGLSAAYQAITQAAVEGEDLRVQVLDASSRPGGVIETVRRDGFLWEGGPDSFITDKPAALQLAQELGLTSQIIGTNKEFQQSFVARNGRLHPTPEGFYLLAPTKMGPLFRTKILSWPGKIRAAMELLVPPRKTNNDESLASFVRRRFGREVLERLAQPMVAGIYSADPETLSLQATFPRFLEMESRGGVIRNMLATRRRPAAVPQGTSGPRYGLFATFQGGVGTLVEAIMARLPPDVYRPRCQVTRLEKRGPSWRLTINGNEHVEADAVVLAVSAPQAARLVGEFDNGLASLLAQTPYGDVATVNVAVRTNRLNHPLNGFGFVVLSVENKTVTGCTFSSVKFSGRAPAGYALLRAFVGGPAVHESDGNLISRVTADLREYLGLKGSPEWVKIRRYLGSMPHYTLGHVARTERAMARAANHPGLRLAGNGYRGIGLPDCIHSGAPVKSLGPI